jgi:hypothetical protein
VIIHYETDLTYLKMHQRRPCYAIQEFDRNRFPHEHHHVFVLRQLLVRIPFGVVLWIIWIVRLFSHHQVADLWKKNPFKVIATLFDFTKYKPLSF